MSDIVTKERVKKGKSVVAKIVFSRTLIIIILLILQIFMLFSIFKWLGHYMTYIYGGFSVLSLILIVYILNNKSNPAFKLAWLLPICVFPVVGAFLYVFINWNFGGQELKKQLSRLWEQSRPYSKINPDTELYLNSTKDIKNIADYLEDIAHNPSFKGGDVTYYSLGEYKFKDMLEELDKAKEFIFLEYFIIEQGIMWNSILEILQKKAREGVEVRVMYDGMCSLVLLPYSYPKKLKRMGIKAKMYSPIVPLLSTSQNNRDHRKILIIDGKVAFNGGVNLADEYINEKKIYGHWKDVAVRVKGDAVRGYTNMFLQMWNVGETKKEDYSKYMTDIKTVQKNQEGLIIPYGDGPTTGENIAENVYIDMLYKAQKYVHIMTPYLIIDNEMQTALTFAAQRGVDVKMILPHIPDKKTAFYIAHTYYPQLIDAGVKIYEYTPGFVHAKVFVSDDIKAVVGTINMDFRSLYHHFECATYLYNNKAIDDIAVDYDKTIEKCQQMTISDYNKFTFFSKLEGRILRMFGYLM